MGDIICVTNVHQAIRCGGSKGVPVRIPNVEGHSSLNHISLILVNRNLRTFWQQFERNLEILFECLKLKMMKILPKVTNKIQ